MDRRSTTDGHILIGGTGRAGTTLLVQWFTALGFDTGFTLDEALSRPDPISGGGLEHSLGRTLKVGRSMPLVAKSPWFGPQLSHYLETGELRAKAAIIPMRKLSQAAESRRAVSKRAEAAGRDPLKHPGGVVGGRSSSLSARQQEKRLAKRFFELIFTLSSHSVPIYFLKFPEFASGRQDMYAVLHGLLEEYGVTASESRAALQVVSRPDLIHDFE